MSLVLSFFYEYRKHGTVHRLRTEFPTTAAPGPLGWHQVGSDISEAVTSFGYKVAISTASNQVAVSSPKALQSTGRADIFEFVDELNKWLSIGSFIIGDLRVI